MKKLLAMGALLVVASTSFGAVTTELSEISTDGGLRTTKYGGNANLPISVKGRVLDLTSGYVLVVTPTTTAGADGASLEFDFGNLLPGTTGNQQVGKFKAEIYGAKKSVMQGTEETKIERKNLNVNGEGGSAISATLVGPVIAEAARNTNDNSGEMVRVNLKSTGSLESEESNEIGEVTYQLVRGAVDGSGLTFEGEVVSTIKINDNAVAGAFNDKSANIKVTVTNFEEK